MQMLFSVLTTVVEDREIGARAITISGEIGIGKTFLLARVCEEARKRNMRVLEMRGYEYSQTFPYFPFIEMLRLVFRRSTLDQLRFYVGLPHAIEHTHEVPASEEKIVLAGVPLVTALAHLFPELPARLHIQVSDEILQPDQEKFRIFDALATMLERVGAEGPLLICMDNIHWMDSSSQELLLYLTLRLRASRIALVGATRLWQSRQELGEGIAKKAGQAAARALGELMQQGMWYPMPLGALSEEEANEHISNLLPGKVTEQARQFLRGRAEGNPLLLEELVRTLSVKKYLYQQQGSWMVKQSASLVLPESIAAMLYQRLQVISPECQNLLEIAALFGRSFLEEALLLVMEGGKEEGDRQGRSLGEVLEEAVGATLIAKELELEEGSPDEAEIGLRVHGSRFTFCQGIFQEILQQRMSMERRRTLHRAIGQALERCYGHEAPAHAAELAAHYAASDERAATLQWSLLAGEEAKRQQAQQRAISHLRLALQLREEGVMPPAEATLKVPTISQLYLTIGELWSQVGELEQATRAFQQVLARGEPMENVLKARLHRALADIYRMQARYEQAISHLQAARELLIDVSNGTDQISLPVPPIRFSASLERKVAIQERVNSGEQILMLQAQASLDVLLNHGQEAEEGLWRAHQIATTLGDRSSQAFSLHMIGWICGWGERIHEAIRLQQQAHQLYLTVGDPYRAALGAQGLGIIYQTLGEMEAAERYTQRGIELARRYGASYVIGWLTWNQGIRALMQGEWEKSATLLQQAYYEGQGQENTRLLPVVLQAQAILQFKRGYWQEAEQLLQNGLQAAENTDWLVSTIALYGYFLAVTGRREEASRQLERAQELTEPIGFSGTFFLPFLVEGYLHLDTAERAIEYRGRMKTMQGFLYYGLSVDRILGEMAVIGRDWKEAERAFARGIQICRRANNQPEEAMIRYEQARMAVIQGREERQVRIYCTQARKLFVQYDMQRAVVLVDTLVEGIQSLQARTEQSEEAVSTSRKVVIQGVEQGLEVRLTAREREVLQLVAEGHTDREVADVLVLSPRTVNRHLSNIFVKLDVAGRAAAVAYAIRQGLV
jgi:DNA-binding CsgD family transcriptional regulator/tetratricopeptide (TPR) repeat protein